MFHMAVFMTDSKSIIIGPFVNISADVDIPSQKEGRPAYGGPVDFQISERRSAIIAPACADLTCEDDIVDQYEECNKNASAYAYVSYDIPDRWYLVFFHGCLLVS